MTHLPISATFASIFVLLYLLLSFRIGYLRGSPVMKLFFKMEKAISEVKLQRTVRAHGNFSEYVPLFLVLSIIIEHNDKLSATLLLSINTIFFCGRLAHGICFTFFDYNPSLRILGMLLTYFGLGCLAILLLLEHFFINFSRIFA